MVEPFGFKEDTMKGHCGKGKGVKALILGLLVLANVQWSIVSWGAFVGIILILAGLVKLMSSSCECEACMKKK